MAKLLEAAQSNDRLETMKALRDMLAERLEQSNSDRDVASMSRRLMQCIAEIAEIEEEQRQREEAEHGSLAEFRKKFNVISERRTLYE